MTQPLTSGRVGSPTLHASIGFTISVFLAILIMAYVFKIEIVAKGQGRLIPVGRVQVVQPEFGGKITAIHVRDGMFVSKDMVVLELDPTDARARLNTLEAEQSRIQTELKRIEIVLGALSDVEALNTVSIDASVVRFTQISPAVSGAFRAEQAALLRAELVELQDAVAQLDARVLTNEESKGVTQAEIGLLEDALTTQEERLQISESLLNNGTTSRSNFLEVLDGYNQIQNQRKVLLQELDEKSALDASIQAERLGLISSTRRRFQNSRADLHAQLTRVSEELITALREMEATRLTAPVSGTVDQLSVYTVGGVISSGHEVMRVVPENQEYEIEAIFPNSDAGFLNVGQTANIKLDAFPSERFGALPGTVINVSADAIEINDSFGFVVRIAPESAELQTSSSNHQLRPGMTSVVDVITGERRIASYFFAPIVKALQDSLGER